jgi:transcription initiation factor TFIIB
MLNHRKDVDVKCELDTCKTYPIITDNERGETYCGGCGLVLLQKMEDRTMEGHSYTQEEFMSNTRTGPGTSLTMNDRGLSTVMGGDIDSTGHAISNKTKSTFNRLRTWDKRSKTRETSSLTKALTQLNAMKTKLGVPEAVVENAAYIYRKAVGARLTRGRTMLSLVAASLYASCRETNTPRTIDDISKAANVEKRILSRDFRTLINKLNMHLEQYDTSSFIVKIANNLNLKEKVKRDALKILHKSEKEKITAGKNPVAQATASLYIACVMNGERVSQKKLSKMSGITDVTIRNRVSLIKKTLKLTQ